VPGAAPEREFYVKYSKAAAVAAGTMIALGAAVPAFADAGAQGAAAQSPGVASGNVVEVPVHVPVDVCGDTVDIIGLLNPTFGNACVNTSTHN
jgi:membrane-bound ClpP family serine protease